MSEARERAAERAAEKAAKNSGMKNVSVKKVKKIKQEKIRFGQAPRNALPPAATETTVTGGDTPLAGQAPGVAMAAPAEATTISTGTGVDTSNPDPLAPQEGPRKKTRYTARQADVQLAKAQDRAVKASQHQQARSVAPTAEEKANETTQAAPLGLNADTAKKKKVHKKGDPKERLQDKPKPVDNTAPIAPTVNPTLGGSAVQPAPQLATAPSSDKTTVPPVDTPPPGQTTPPGRRSSHAARHG